MKYLLLAIFLGLLSLQGADNAKVTSEIEAAKIEILKAKDEATAAKQESKIVAQELAKLRATLDEQKASKATDEQKTLRVADEQRTLRAIEEQRTLRMMEEQKAQRAAQNLILEKNKTVTISVIGQGVAPVHTTSPAQAYALAKRAAIADAYRALAEKIKGIRVDGQDLVKNMMMQRSIIRTHVEAIVRNATLVETTFKDGLCEVEMEIVIYYSDFA